MSKHRPPSPMPHPLSNAQHPPCPPVCSRGAKYSPGANCLLTTAYCLLLLLAGCTNRESNRDPTPAEKPLAGLKLRLLVVADPEIAAAAAQLRGEWAAQTGAELQVDQMSEKELENASSLSADAIICPSYQLGPLAERKLLAPLPKKLLDAAAANWPDIFELLRLREASWGEQVYAVPFGSPVLTCYYRADLLAKVGQKPPRDWAEYQQLAKLLANRKAMGDLAPPDEARWSGTVEPLGPGWAGLVLLARAAPYAKSRSNYSALFDMRTMEPLVSGPPLVRALEELAAAAKLGPAGQLQYDPAAARTAFWQGQCGMALSWPSAAKPPAGKHDPSTDTTAGTSADAGADTNADNCIEVGFVELPGSQPVFDVSSRTWSKRSEEDDPHVALLAATGRIGVLTASATQPEAAVQLLLWLSGGEISPQVCAASPATTLFRRSHLKSPHAWTEPPIPEAAAAQYAAVTERTLSREQWLCALPVPGRAEYLAALDEAVYRVVRGEQPAIEALHEAAERWRQITQRLGVENQRKAYVHSLGLE